jgi:hypothetical protein
MTACGTRRPRVVLGVLGALLVGAPVTLDAQGQGLVALPELDGRVRIDGVVDESAWEAVPPLPLTTHTPAYGRRPSEVTTIRIAYDADYLYAAGVFFDTDPDGIRSNSLYRDRWAGDDVFTLFLDTFNSNESALWFETNPAGVRMDRTLSDDATHHDDSWNTFWDVATTRFAEGWAAEMRIPLSSLPLQVRDGRVVMGLTVGRLIARKNEWVTVPAIGPSWNIRQPSVAQDVVLEGVRRRNPTYLTPYVLAGLDRQWHTLDAGGGYQPDRQVTTEAGIDLKRSLTANLTLDLTVNTDFAQVEVDDQQVNLTQFSLFYPEKRQFFQERADVFAFNLREGGQLFYSRRIGLTEDGDPVRILGGGRVVGRVGAWDLGVLNMQTAAASEVPAENLGAVRWRRRVFNEFSYTGGMMTTRVNTDGDYNVGMGLDLALRPTPRDLIAFDAAHTLDSDPMAAGLLARTQLHARWQRRATRGLSFTTDFNRVGRDYRPELGFVDRRDFTWMQFFGEYDILPAEAFLRRWGPGVLVSADVRTSDGSVRQSRWLHWWNYEFPSGASGWIEGLYYRENVQQPFRIANAVDIPAGDYRYFIFNAHHSTAAGTLLRLSTDLRVGSFYDGWRTSVTSDVTWNVWNHLEWVGAYVLNVLRFADRDQDVDTHLAQVRIRAAANAKASATIFLQYNSVTDRVSVNARMRYNFREGTDLWFVYDEGINTDRTPVSQTDPLLPWSGNRAVRVKLTYTFAP